MKILLVNPPFSRLRGTKECTEMVSPLGLSTVAAYLHEKEFDVCVYDINNSFRERFRRFNKVENLLESYSQYSENLKNDSHPAWVEFREILKREKPNVVGMTVLSPVYGAAARLTQMCREFDSNIKVVFGGFHPSIFPDKVLSDGAADVVVRSEGEHTFFRIVSRWDRGRDIDKIRGISYIRDGEIVHNPDRPLIDDLDSLPFAADFMPPTPTGKIPIQYARGCPYTCKFCADRVIWRRKVRHRSAASIVDEIEYNIKKNGIREFTFVDGTFNVSRKKLMELCDEITKRKVKILWDALVKSGNLDDELVSACRRAGCVQMNIGVETGSERILKALTKKIDRPTLVREIDTLHKNNIAAISFFCIGMPPEEEEDIEATRDFIAELDHDYVILAIYTPLPGSDFFNELLEAGHINMDHNFDTFGYKSAQNYYALNIPQDRFFYWRDQVAEEVNKVNTSGRLVKRLLFGNMGFYAMHPGQLMRRAIRFIGF